MLDAVAGCPATRPGAGVEGNRGVPGNAVSIRAAAGDENPRPVRAHRQCLRGVVEGSLAVVERGPQHGAGGGVEGPGRELQQTAAVLAGAGDENPRSVRTHAHEATVA